MIKIYGLNTCPDCCCLKKQIEERADKFEYIDIGEHVLNLKEFLCIRDSNVIFENCKASGSIGIPCFVMEDGNISLDPSDVGLEV